MDFRDRPITTRLIFLALPPGEPVHRPSTLNSKDFGYERTIIFSLYKLDFDSLDWEIMECINDKAVNFIGNGNSWSVSQANCVKCRTNSTCYTDDMKSGSGRDVGVYFMETGNTESLRFMLMFLSPNHLRHG
ncbi:hypothetical protein TorRG33x02_333510 [Trema orientale]|uniref:KIB1-4 beta-propeller domain-containing protein n=1 Tax=Trema orientale TaxID=63057 RepID=A0A2P5B4A6_TREOI|nr:hypothetical protein TorRG33x02_333510 [Trema orientale]